MKRAGMVFVLTLFAVMAANAQEGYGTEISASTGYVIPASPMTFANYWTMQYGGGIRAGMPLSEVITLVGSFEYYRFRLDEEGIDEAYDTQYMRDIWLFDEVSLTPSADASYVATIAAEVRVTPSGRTGFVSPYFMGGVGIMRFSLSEIVLAPTSVLSINGSAITMTSEQTLTGGAATTLCVELGVGVDVRLGESSEMFVEARYTTGLSQGSSAAYIPLTAGVRFRL